MVQGSRCWIEGRRNDHLLPGHLATSLTWGVKAEGIRHEVDAPQSAVRLRPRARCASPPSAGHRLRTLRVPALVTPESGVSATPPPRMATPTGWEVDPSMRASVRYGSPEAGTSGRSGLPRETRSDGSAHLPVMLHDRLTGTGQRPGGSVVNHNRCSRVCYTVPRNVTSHSSTAHQRATPASSTLPRSRCKQ